jgi:3'-5' exoribonuclease
MAITCLLELSESGQRFEGNVLIKSVQDATTAGGSPYFNITVSKKHKNISSKLWENKFGGNTVSDIKRVLQSGSVHFIIGSVSEYRGELQLTIDEFHLCKDGETDITDYLEAAPEPIEKLQKEYEQYLNDIQSPILHTICQQLYDDHKKEFVTFPAAKSNHHAFVGGLLYHTVSMLRIAKHIVSQYPQVNRSLLFASIALHDFGKVVELTSYIAADYTKVGNFLGHITIVNMFIDRKTQKLKEDKDKWTREDFDQVYELMHIISAHHGKLEWGSPVTSKILEAEIIHHIDMIDSRINMIVNGLSDDSLAGGEPKKIFPLGIYYKSTLNDL